MKGKRTLSVAVISLVLAAMALPAEAGAARTRPGKSGASRAASSSSHHRGGSHGHRSRGHRPYRHHSYGHRSYSLHGYYGGYSSFYPSIYAWWGWPYAYPVWGYGPVGYSASGPRGGPGAVETDVKPKKANVVVDGQAYGRAKDYNGAWDLLFLEPGEHWVVFEAPGYKTLRVRLLVRSGGYHHIAQRLVEGEGIDARSSPETPPDVADSAPPAFDEAERAAGIAPAPQTPGLRQGRLRIDVAPDDAAVYLDGAFLARADELARLHGALPVAAGRHVIEVVRPGYTTERHEVNVSGDDAVRAVVTLERER